MEEEKDLDETEKLSQEGEKKEVYTKEESDNIEEGVKVEEGDNIEEVSTIEEEDKMEEGGIMEEGDNKEDGDIVEEGDGIEEGDIIGEGDGTQEGDNKEEADGIEEGDIIEEGDGTQEGDNKEEADGIEEGDIIEEGDGIEEEDNKEEGDIIEEDDDIEEDNKEEGDIVEEGDIIEEGDNIEVGDGIEEESDQIVEEITQIEQRGEEKREGEKKLTDIPHHKLWKSKENETKVRRVDMSEYYPEESISSVEGTKSPKDKEERKIALSGEKTDVTKDFNKADLSFLDEFVISEEKIAFAKDYEEEEEEEFEFFTEAEREEEAQEEIYVQPPKRELSDKIYDRICDLETPVSTDESFTIPKFKHIGRRIKGDKKKARTEQEKLFLPTASEKSIEVPSHILEYLNEYIAPGLKKTLMEIAMYQPENPVYYMTHSLFHKTKTDEEIGLDPDPHLIQALVDEHKKKMKKKKKMLARKTDVFLEPFGESNTVFPRVAKVKVKVSSSEDEDPSHIRKIQKKYKKAKTKLITEEKNKRSILKRGKPMHPGTCLGPTSLPFVEVLLPKPRAST